MSARTVTIRDREYAPVNGTATAVMADGPQWCEREDQRIRVYNGRDIAPGILRRLLRLMTAQQREDYEAIFARVGQPGDGFERRAYCRVVLGLPTIHNDAVALTRLLAKPGARE